MLPSDMHSSLEFLLDLVQLLSDLRITYSSVIVYVIFSYLFSNVLILSGLVFDGFNIYIGEWLNIVRYEDVTTSYGLRSIKSEF